MDSYKEPEPKINKVQFEVIENEKLLKYALDTKA